MMRSLSLTLIGLLVTAAAAMGSRPQAPVENPRVIIDTELGQIEVELDAARAPVTVANFLKYVDGGFYQGGRFYRTVRTDPDNQPDDDVKIDVVQGTINPARRRDRLPAIALERTSETGLHHVNGTISMARVGPDTATYEFFICLGDQPALDAGGARNPDGQGFAAFGQVVRGLDVVRRIQQSPAEGQTLRPVVAILSTRRVHEE